MAFTKEEFADFIAKGGIKASALALSENTEIGFYKEGESWRVMDLVDDFCAFGPALPGYIPENEIAGFYRWFAFAIKSEHDKGRKFGEDAMRAAIRGLLGAAPLTAFDH
jgi:hypothetical protein